MFYYRYYTTSHKLIYANKQYEHNITFNYVCSW